MYWWKVKEAVENVESCKHIRDTEFSHNPWTHCKGEVIAYLLNMELRPAAILA
jgi:hypothetical protein